MLKILVLCLALLPVLAKATPAEELASNLASFKTFTANFSQSTFAGKKEIEKASGRIIIQRPGNFYWETFKPSKQVIIATKDVVWTYDVSLMQATRQRLSQQKGLTPANLLSGSPNKVLPYVNVALATDKNLLDTYRLTPKERGSSFVKLELSFRHKVLVMMESWNQLGQHTLFTFTDITIDKPINSHFFHFIPPEGVDILKN